MKHILTAAVAAFLACGCTKENDDTLKMITEAAFPPYEFMRGAELVGIDVEICKAVAQKLGREFRSETVEFDAVMPAIVSGKADIAAAGITVTEDRKKNVDFSIPYVKTGIVVVYKGSNPFSTVEELKSKRIGVQSGSTSETFVLEKLGQEPERYRSPVEAVAALKAGRVDFVVTDIDPAKNCVKNEIDLTYSDFVSSEEYAVAINKGRPELLKAVNETIAEIKADGRLEKWIEQYTAEADRLKD